MARESGVDELCATTMGRPRSPGKGGPRGGTSWGIPAVARDVGCLTFAGTGQKAYRNQRRGRGGTGRRKGLKTPRWQRRVGSSPTARTTLRPYGLRVAQPHWTVRGKRVRRSLTSAKAKTDTPRSRRRGEAAAPGPKRRRRASVRELRLGKPPLRTTRGAATLDRPSQIPPEVVFAGREIDHGRTER